MTRGTNIFVEPVARDQICGTVKHGHQQPAQQMHISEQQLQHPSNHAPSEPGGDGGGESAASMSLGTTGATTRVSCADGTTRTVWHRIGIIAVAVSATEFTLLNDSMRASVRRKVR